ncbi:MAG: hypothetical protein P4M14_10245 [Gammaproteobacteria bacterium]|nr:hypothetical protein [Gammaproteobacteria bacterium]
MIRSKNKAALFQTLSTLLIATTCTAALAEGEITHAKQHHLIPLMESNRLTPAHQASSIGELAVINNVHWQNAQGNVHINNRPTMLSALYSVTIPKEVASSLKPNPEIVERPPEFVLIQAGLTTRTVNNELVTVIQDQMPLQAQVASTKNRADCAKASGCEADEIVLQ